MEDTLVLTVLFSSILYKTKINHCSHTDASNTHLEYDHQVECPGLNRTVVAKLFAILAPNMNTVLLKIGTEVNFKSMHYMGLSGNLTMSFCPLFYLPARCRCFLPSLQMASLGWYIV